MVTFEPRPAQATREGRVIFIETGCDGRPGRSLCWAFRGTSGRRHESCRYGEQTPVIPNAAKNKHRGAWNTRKLCLISLQHQIPVGRTDEHALSIQGRGPLVNESCFQEFLTLLVHSSATSASWFFIIAILERNPSTKGARARDTFLQRYPLPRR